LSLVVYTPINIVSELPFIWHCNHWLWAILVSLSYWQYCQSVQHIHPLIISALIAPFSIYCHMLA